MMSEHKHSWKTRYLEVDGKDWSSGMECECGATIHQNDVEEIVNNSPAIANTLLLLPCPFCGEAKEIVARPCIGDIWVVACRACQSQTGPALQKGHAIKQWNERKGPGCGALEHKGVS
jgi:Lar family restriction alleviation protein